MFSICVVHMANMSICKFIQPQFKVHQKRFSKEPKRIFIPFELLLSHSMVNISTVKFPHSICLSTLKIFIFQITFCFFFFIFKLHNKKREKFSNSHTHSLSLPKSFHVSNKSPCHTHTHRCLRQEREN